MRSLQSLCHGHVLVIFRCIRRQSNWLSILMILATAFYFHLHNQLKISTQHDIKLSLDNLSPHHYADNNRLKIASWNLRVPFPPDIERNLSWMERRDSIASAITYYRPDLLAVQEDCYFMSHDLMNAQTSTLSKGEKMLSDIYKRHGLFNRNGDSYPTTNWHTNAFSSIVGRDGEHNSIWYNKHKFHAVQNVTFWLSRTPNVPGSSFDEVTGRIVNCVLLQGRLLFNDRDGTITNSSTQCTDVFYCSTHLPSGNMTRQLWSVDVLSQMFAQYHDKFTTKGYSSKENNNQLLMMVAGDFNSAPNSETYNAMIESGFVDARQLSQERIPIEQYTFTTNDWYAAEDSMIDHVWIYLGKREGRARKPPRSVASVRHVSIPCCDIDLNLGKDPLNKTASDHLMVIVEFDSFYIYRVLKFQHDMR